MTKKPTPTGRPGLLAQLLPDRKVALYMFGGVLLALAVYFGFTHRMQDQHSATQRKIAAARADLISSQSALTLILRSQVSANAATATVRLDDILLPQTVNAASVANTLSTQAAGAPYLVTVNQMDPGLPVAGTAKKLGYQPFSVMATGTASGLFKMLSQLILGNPHLLTVSHVVYAALPSTDVRTMTFTLKAWYDGSDPLPQIGATS